jgi:CRP-like cAMP-binding protein
MTFSGTVECRSCLHLAAANMIAIMSDLLVRLATFRSEPIEVGAGEGLFQRDGEIRFLFVVEDGLIHLVRHQIDGAPTVMQRAVRDDVVAEASIFAGHYHCDAVAIKHTRLRRVTMTAVRQAMRTDPTFAHACAEYLAHEVHRMRVRSEILGMRTVASRLDAWLALKPFPPKGERAALADDIGITREALYRELAKRKIATL